MKKKYFISIFIVLGNSSKPKDAIRISLIVITGTVFPFATYVRTAFPMQNPTITPILPNLFKIPANIPDMAYAAIIIGSVPVIVP